MDKTEIYREILSLISFESADPYQILQIKRAVCGRYELPEVPKNSALLAAAPPEQYEKFRRLLLVKPTRTLSGVAPIAVMTSPSPCPHGKCLPCPGGPDHPFKSPQSYTGEEPAAKRAREHNYDPYNQVSARLDQFKLLGHHVDKAELIVMGGTMTARTPEYQESFVAACLQAMNESGTEIREEPRPLETVMQANERSDVRCVALTFETRPDWSKREHIDSMLRLGVTKVELGVQHLDDEILTFNRRGCTVADIVEANTSLRDAGIKVGFHMMPNLPGSTIEKDRAMFLTLFDDPRFRPDFLKLYPTLVTPYSEIEDLLNRGGYAPYAEDDLIDLIAYAKELLPEYVRLQRVQRDIPAKLIVAGSHHSNFRQLAEGRLHAAGKRCRCIRCREIGRYPPPKGAVAGIQTLAYDCCEGREFFISAVAGDSLIGFLRLRFPGNPWREELADAALVRELHVYGMVVPIGDEAEPAEYQHRQFGVQLLAEAERLAGDAGFSSLAIMSGIGVRPYYQRQGYMRTGPYMVKRLA
jgi:elongator complex protein 3